ncbi:MAG: hypothetical protein GX594_09540 [Pirellulaceae bacterium]|nr:hypothetical protein [Pirellulaceae bacterium]
MSWISTQELVSRGIPRSAIDKAVAERRLKGTRLSNEEMAFDCVAINSWLGGRPAGVDASAAKQGLANYQREEEATVRREQSARAATSPATPVAPVSPQRSAEETLANLVGHVMRQENVSEVEARQKILRDSPDLRQRLRAKANSDRPPQGTREREDLRERAAAYSDSIPTR